MYIKKEAFEAEFKAFVKTICGDHIYDIIWPNAKKIFNATFEYGSDARKNIDIETMKISLYSHFMYSRVNSSNYVGFGIEIRDNGSVYDKKWEIRSKYQSAKGDFIWDPK